MENTEAEWRTFQELHSSGKVKEPAGDELDIIWVY